MSRETRVPFEKILPPTLTFNKGCVLKGAVSFGSILHRSSGYQGTILVQDLLRFQRIGSPWDSKVLPTMAILATTKNIYTRDSGSYMLYPEDIRCTTYHAHVLYVS